MKKLYTKFIICLGLGVLTNHALLSLLFFNQRFNIFWITQWWIENRKEEYLLEILPLIFVISVSGVVSFVFNVFFSKIARKQINEIDKSKVGIIKSVCIIMTIILYVISNIIVYEQYFKFKQEYFSGMTSFLSGNSYEEQTQTLELMRLYFNSIPVTKGSVLYVIIFMIPTIILLFKTIKNKENKHRKIFKIISNCSISFLLIGAAFVNIIYYTDIPEFKYSYMEIDGEIEILGYSDNREMFYQEELIVPDKLRQKDVVAVNSYFGTTWYYPNIKIVLPNTLKWEKFFTDKNGIWCFNQNEILMSGNPIEWKIENDIISSIDDTEVYLTNVNKIEIDSKVEKIKNFTRLWFLADDSILTINKLNPYFYVYDNCIYTKSNIFFEGTTIDEEKLNIGMNFVKKSNIEIPENISGKLRFLIYITNPEEIIIKIPNTMKNEFMIHHALDFNFKYELSEDNKYFTYENGILYNKDKTKIINFDSSVYDSKKLVIENNVQEINKDIITCYIDFEFIISPENKYIEKIESGDIIYKNQ